MIAIWNERLAHENVEKVEPFQHSHKPFFLHVCAIYE
jgi:hypothetical protein